MQIAISEQTSELGNHNSSGELWFDIITQLFFFRIFFLAPMKLFRGKIFAVEL